MTTRSLFVRPGREVPVYFADSAALGAAGVFNTPLNDPADTFYESRDITSIIYGLESTQNGANPTAVIQESSDGINVHLSTTLTDDTPAALATAGTPVRGTHVPTLKYWRFKWTNGSTPGVLIGRVNVRGH